MSETEQIIKVCDEYGNNRVLDALDRIMRKTIDWNHIETMQSNGDAAASALNMLHEEIEAIRSEIESINLNVRN